MNDRTPNKLEPDEGRAFQEGYEKGKNDILFEIGKIVETYPDTFFDKYKNSTIKTILSNAKEVFEKYKNK